MRLALFKIVAALDEWLWLMKGVYLVYGLCAYNIGPSIYKDIIFN